jgi:hypothetical protein
MKFTIIAIFASVAAAIRVSSIEDARHQTEDAKHKFEAAMRKLNEDKVHLDQEAAMYAKKAADEKNSLKHRFSR